MAQTMEYNFLGRSGLTVSNICLGTMTFGRTDRAFPEFLNSRRQADEELSHKLMDRYVELGGNFIDTADVYAMGDTEAIIGRWLLKQEREKLVIATKARFPLKSDNPNYVGLSRRHLIESCDASLKRLQTDFIDLYQAHMWDYATPIEETLRTFDDLVRCGKIRYYGFSNVYGWQLQKIADAAKELGLNQCISLQQEYSLLHRYNDHEAFMVCRNEGMGVIPYAPLKSGLLTGKFTRTDIPDENESRLGMLHKYGNLGLPMPEWSSYSNNETYWNLMDEMRIIAKNHDKSVSQVALRWLLQKDIVSSVIIGVTSLNQLEDNIGAATGWKLTEDEMAKLDELSRPELCPYVQLWQGFGGPRYNRFNH